MLSSVLSSSEMTKMWTQSEWDEEEERWIVPHLQFNNRWRNGGGVSSSGEHFQERPRSAVDWTSSSKRQCENNREEEEEQQQQQQERRRRKRRKEKKKRRKRQEMMRRKEEEGEVVESMF